MKHLMSADKEARLRARRARRQAKARARSTGQPTLAVWVHSEPARSPRGWDWA